MYLSDFNASRKNNYNINEYRETTVNELRSGKSHSNILYIFSNYPDDNIITTNMNIYSANSYFIATKHTINGQMPFDQLKIEQITELDTYLAKLKELENHVIIICARDEASMGLSQNNIRGLQRLGLIDLRGHFRESYIAIIDGGKIMYEEVSNDILKKSILLNNETLSIISAGGEAGYQQSILFNETEQSVQERGLNIVVYDKSANQIIDSVCFDTYADATCYRQ